MMKLTDDMDELPLVIDGADIYIVAKHSRLPLATYMNCRIFVANSVHPEDVVEFRSNFVMCSFITNSTFTPENPAPPRTEIGAGYVGDDRRAAFTVHKGGKDA